jgi:hypothetical protein
MTPRGRLLVSASVLAGFFAAFHLIVPFRLHVGPFLALFAFCFAVYLYCLSQTRRMGDVSHSLWLVLGFAILYRALFLLAPPSLSDDIYRYVWDGRVQQAGLNPYLYPPASDDLAALRDENHSLINHPTVRTVYPPLSQLLFRWGVALDPSIAMQRFLFVLFDLGTTVLLGLWLRRLGRSPLGAVVYAWNPLAVIEFASSGHNDSLMIFFLVLTLFLISEGKKAASGVAWGLAALSKLIPFVLVPWVVVQKNHRMGAAFVATVVAGCLPFSNVLFDPALRSAPYISGVTSYATDWVFNPSLYGILALMTSNRALVKVILGLVLVVFSFYWAARCRDNVVRYAFGCLFALLLASPVVHPWYVLWVLPFLCFEMNNSALLWTALSPMTYVVLIRYAAEGIWSLPPWVSWVEYGGVYGALAWGFVERKSNRV